MTNDEFESLIKKRKDWVKSSKENQFDFDSILAGLYSDPSHFIYEILQNAEDAKNEKIKGAKKVRFELFEDRLDIYHNGANFDYKDIEGVTGIGISKKKDDLTSIGKFGVGFKSVFAVTETPYIFSGEYRIKIKDFVVPSAVSNNEQVNETLIRLPFNHKSRSPKEVFTLISKKLENMGLKTLLFLKNIEEITWQTPSSSGQYSKSSESFQVMPNARKVVLRSSTVTEEYIIIEKPIEIEGKNLKVEVAYKLGKDKSGKKIIIPEPDSKLVVFFQTGRVTYLNFVIQGPFKTTPDRVDIPLEDEQNKKILEEIGNLVAESLSIIKDLGYLDTNFLSILPLSSNLAEREKIYSVIYEKLKEKFLSEKLLPTSDGTYIKAGDALLARGKELTEFLNNNDIQNLFSKQNWLDTNITYDKTRELRDYLINELGVIEVDFESFARKITVEFLQTKSDEWMIDFYRRLLDQQSLWSEREYPKGILRAKPIIRLENNEHMAPFDSDGKVQVYLPAETKSKYKTVKCSLTENEESLKFLKELGLTKPDLLAEVKEFILPKYQKENPIKDESYFEDVEKLLTVYENIPANKKREFMEELSRAYFIDSVHNGTGENHLRKPLEAYFNDNDLKDYFAGYADVYFTSNELYEMFGEKKLKPFLMDLKVEDKPRRIEIDANLTWEEKSKLRGNNGCTYDIHQKDYEYEGLENFLNNGLTIEKSLLLWRLLLQNIENLNSWQANKFFEGEYKWFYYSEHKRSFKARFLKTLKRLKWLFDKNNKLRNPSDITFSELSDDYIKKASPNIDILIKVLEFKPEIIDLLPEYDRRILEIARAGNITPDELEKILSERKEKPLEPEKEQWAPECEPDTPAVRIQEVEPDKIITADLSGQIENIEAGGDGKSTNNEIKKPEEEVEKTPIDKKAIGKWGEKYVYNALREKYQGQGDIIETDFGFKVIDADGEEFEIIWLNKHQDKGKGYDFVIRKKETETEYIEVKTKIGGSDELIEVTGTQWEFARKLFDQNEGERYSFYVVSNAGEKNAEIRILRNPIKLWKEGKLYAHPVNFKL